YEHTVDGRTEVPSSAHRARASGYNAAPGNRLARARPDHGSRTNASPSPGRANPLLLRVDRPRLLVLRGIRPAGAGGRDLLGLRRADDPRVRVVAHRGVGRGVARRRA